MGQINFETWKTQQTEAKKATTTSTYQSDKPYVGYFTLKNDKDYAIVRIMHDSPEDFDMVKGHRMTVRDKLRLVNCLREDNEAVEKCPLCAAGKKTEEKIYIHLIEYTTDENNQVVATPKVWERSAGFANTLLNYINEYGPLSDVVLKITRNGAAGSKKTSYDIMMANPNVYRPEIYPKKSELFEGYKAVGTAVINYKAETLMDLLSQSPMEAATPRTYTAAPAYGAPVAPPTYSTPAPATPTYETPAPRPAPNYSAPQTPEQPAVARPQRRYYN